MLAPIVLLVTTSIGGALGWYAGTPMGLMGAYLCSVLGSSIGLYLGRKIQRNLKGD